MVQKNFIPKLETEKYLLGSFDACLQESRSLVLENSLLDELSEIDTKECTVGDSKLLEIIDKYLSTLPTLFRAAITTKEKEYVGYIALTNVCYPKHSTDVIMEVKKDLSNKAINEILDEYMEYVHDFLNLKTFHTVTIKQKGNMVVNTIHKKNNDEKLSISTTVLDSWINLKYIEEKNQEHNLVYPCAMLDNDKTIGIIGLKNVNYPNQRAQIEMVFEDDYQEDYKVGMYLESYARFVKRYDIPDAMCLIPASNKIRRESAEKANFSYFGCIPYSIQNKNEDYESLLIYHYGYTNADNYDLDRYKYDRASDQTSISTPQDRIKINSKYSLVNPKTLDQITLDRAVYNHAWALTDREHFSIPLGEDKYFPQIGCDNYGVYKAVKNFTYLIMDDKNNYIGFVNIIRGNGKNIEIEIGIKPSLQNRGIGTLALSTFYDEMFRIGYYSVTSSVFSFNHISRHMHEKLSENTAIKVHTYYAYERLWDMYIYTKVNPNIK